MAASGGSRPASWKAWRRWPFPRSATASATISACSARSSRRAGSRNIPTSGSASATPGNSSGPRWSIRCISAAMSTHVDDRGRERASWHPGETVQAVAYDTPIVGWRGQHVNALRLWSARSPDPLRLDAFNTGDYLGAVAEEARAESICKFLYPNDESAAGRELRLRQEYFFVSASLQDLVKRHLAADGQLRSLAQKAAVQLNDTHPSLAVTELMRHPGRPAQFPLGRGLEDHGRDAVLHQPHAAAGSAGDLAGRTVRAAAAAASRNHLPHQCRASGAGRSSAAPAISISAPRCR